LTPQIPLGTPLLNTLLRKKKMRIQKKGGKERKKERKKQRARSGTGSK
jgi:hypothetical protein